MGKKFKRIVALVSVILLLMVDLYQPIQLIAQETIEAAQDAQSSETTPTPTPTSEAETQPEPTEAVTPTPESMPSPTSSEPIPTTSPEITPTPTQAPVLAAEAINGAYVEGEVIVKYKEQEINLENADGRLEAAIFENQHNLDKEDEIKDLNIQVLSSDTKSTGELLAELKSDPNVERVEPNRIRKVTTTPNDTNFANLWGLNNTGQMVNGTIGTTDADIDAPEAWDIESSSQTDVVVAVLDTGVLYTHTDLINNMWDGTSSCKDENGNTIAGGCPNHGWDFVNNDNDPTDDNGHGTHIAGTIAADANNGAGISGISIGDNLKIMAVKFLGADGDGTVANELKAINFARHNNAKVINASFGAAGFLQSEKNAVDAFTGLFVAAAGNGGDDGVGDNNDGADPEYPCSYSSSNIVCVAATTQSDGRASFSNYGATTVDVGAPGVNIYSTYYNGNYTFLNGTSMATPHVAGLAGLLFSYAPTLSTSEVKTKILNTGDSVGSLNGNTLTGKRINAYNALAQTDVNAPTVTGVSSTNSDGYYRSAQSIAVTITFSENVIITGSPRLLLETGFTDRYATYASGSGTSILTFNYIVQTGDSSSNLDYASTSALELNGGTIRNSASNNATLTLPTPGATNSLGANKALVVDAVSPTITSYTLDNTRISPQVSAGVKDSANFDLAFSEQVAADFDIVNSGGTTVKDVYNSGSVTNPTAKTWDGTNNSSAQVSDGVYAIRIVITDAAGNSLTDTSRTITVDNDPLTLNPIGNKTANEETALTFTATATDEDGGSPTFSLINAPTGASINSTTGAFSWTPTEAQGPDQFTFSVQAAVNSLIESEQIVVTVNEVNVTPVASNVSASTNEDTAVTITLQGTDADVPTNTLTYTILSNPTKGTLGSVSGNQVTYTPTSNLNGSESFTYRVSDGSLNSNTATVSLTINPINDAPVAVADSTTTLRNNALVVAGSTFAANDTDVDGDSLAVTAVSNATNGTVALNSGTVTFTPTSNYVGPASFEYIISDGALTSTATVKISVNPPTSSGEVIATPITDVTATNPEVVLIDLDVSGSVVINVPATVTNPTLDLTNLTSVSAGVETATLSDAVTVNTSTSSGTLILQLPASLQIQGDDAFWNGVMNNPTVQSNSSVTLPVTGTASTVVEIGFGNVPLTLNFGVRILLPGQGGKLAGYVRNGVFTEITNICASDSQATGNALPAGGDCKITVGSDLVIWTKHFTQFVAYSLGSSTGSPSSGGEGTANTSPPVCYDQKPGSAPRLISARITGLGEVTLTWSKAADPVTYYLVAYGTKSGELKYGNPNAGDRNTTSYTVKGLTGGKTYYFRVRAGNGCTPGDYSNEAQALVLSIGGSEAAEGFQEGVLGQADGDETGKESGQEGTESQEGDVKAKETESAPSLLKAPLAPQNRTKTLAVIAAALLLITGAFYLSRKSN